MKKEIIAQRSSTIRAVARQKLNNNWASVTLVVMLYTIFIGWIPGFLDSIAGSPLSVKLSDYYFYVTNFFVEGFDSNLVEFFPGIANPNIKVSYWSVLYILLFLGVLLLGSRMLMLRFVRTRTVEYKLLFGGFKYYFKATLMFIIIEIKVFLWTLLFIVPGIIAMINYSQAVIIMADDPSKGIMQCIKESCELMKGNKKKFFCFVLSYAGWFALTILVILSLLGITILFTGLVISSFVISIIEFIPLGFFFAYYETGRMVFYETLVGNLIPVDDLYYEQMKQKRTNQSQQEEKQ